MTTLTSLDIDFRRVTPISAARSFVGQPITDEARLETFVESALRGYAHSTISQAKARAVRLMHSGHTLNESLRRVEAWARSAIDTNTPPSAA